MSILLLPCPFCGGESAFGTKRYCEKTVKENEWKQDIFHAVNCIMCGVSNGNLVGWETQEKAAQHWNKRT